MDQPGFLISLTDRALDGEYQHAIGRDRVIKQIIDSLAPKSTEHPMLLGPPGVGKTQLVQSVALVLAQLRSPTRLYEVDQATFSSDTKYMGEMEGKMKSLLSFAAAQSGSVFFIDEFHSMIGRGSSIGHESGVEQLLKPAMTNGSIKIIAATTDSEYEQYIRPDGALARRFCEISVPSLDSNSTTEVLEKINRQERALGKANFSDSIVAEVVKISSQLQASMPFGEPARAIKVFSSLKREFQSDSKDGLKLNTEPISALRDLYSKIKSGAEPSAVKECLAKNFAGSIANSISDDSANAFLQILITKNNQKQQEAARGSIKWDS